MREEHNEKTNQLYAKIDEIRKKYNLTGDRSIGDLRQELRRWLRGEVIRIRGR